MEEATPGSFISHRRQELGISQRDLAKALKISSSTVSRIENEENISLDNAALRRFAKVLRRDYNCLSALNKMSDDRPEIRMLRSAEMNMPSEQLRDMITVLRASFHEEFGREGSDEDDERRG